MLLPYRRPWVRDVDRLFEVLRPIKVWDFGTMPGAAYARVPIDEIRSTVIRCWTGQGARVARRVLQFNLWLFAPLHSPVSSAHLSPGELYNEPQPYLPYVCNMSAVVELHRGLHGAGFNDYPHPYAPISPMVLDVSGRGAVWLEEPVEC